MNFKNQSIFEKNIEKSNLKKIYLNKDHNSNWYFQDNKGNKFILAPSAFVEMSFSPLIAGANKAILFGCKQKNIDPSNGINLYFSEEQFLDADVRIEFKEIFFDGWIYDIYPENIKVDPGQKIWACNYLKLYYQQPPEKLYLRIESNLL